MARGENALIAVAGAPTAVTNGVMAGILDQVGEESDLFEVYGAHLGLSAFLEGRCIDLMAQKRQTIENLRRTPGSVLSGRYRFFGEDEGAAFIAALQKQDIGTLFLLGGLPSIELAKFALKAAQDASYDLRVMGVPLSAENEVAAGDHCPGYASAARFAAAATRDAARGAQGGEEPLIVLEVGGAGAGWLAAATALARDENDSAPHSILLPERPVEREELVEEVRRAYQKHSYVVAVTTDGATDTTGESLSAAPLADLLSERLNLPARYDRLGFSASVNGSHIVRTDADEAHSLGQLVVRLADDGLSGYVVALGRDAEGKGERGYRVIETSLKLEQVEEFPRAFPEEYIAESGTNVSEAFLEWARPLLGGPLPEYAVLAS